MATAIVTTEIVSEVRRPSRRDFSTPKWRDGPSASYVPAQDRTVEKNIDYLVDLLNNGDVQQQRYAAEVLTTLEFTKKRLRDHIRDIGGVALFVHRLSSPDVHIREHMITLLYALAVDDEDSNTARGDALPRKTATTQLILDFLEGGPGAKAFETAAKLLFSLSNIDGLKDSLASSGVIEALVTVLRYRKGLCFQQDAIAKLAYFLRKNDKNKVSAAKACIVPILLRLLMYGHPPQIDIDGILDLLAVLATHHECCKELVQLNASQSLLALVKSGRLAQQVDKVDIILKALKRTQDLIADMEKLPPQPEDSHEKVYDDQYVCRDWRENLDSKTSADPMTILTTATVSDGTKTSPDVPNEFLCPISGKLMADPVSLSTGETYDSKFIQEWLDRGERTCPVTGEHLTDFELRPNIAAKVQISKWLEENGEQILPGCSYRTGNQSESSMPSSSGTGEAADHRSTDGPINNGSVTTLAVVDPSQGSGGDGDSGADEETRAASGPDGDEDDEDRPVSEEERAQVQSFLDTLLSRNASEENLTAAASGLHDLAFSSKSLRAEIALGGAVSPLASLLSAEHDTSTQEAGVATLLILSLNDENKYSLARPVSAVVPAVVSLLKHGSEDGREQAASTLFSLSILDENKVTIGAAGAIPALVDVLSGRDPLSKKAQKDAATCLLTLAIYRGNKTQAVKEGVVPHLIALLESDDSLQDLVLALLAVLSSHPDARTEIERQNLLPKLLDIMRSGSDRHIENALVIFFQLITKNPDLIAEAGLLKADETLMELCRTSAPGRIKTKTLRLLEFVERYESSRG